eukprot:GAHX01001556.1.p1 GENE.GAHX01001556.1~~GAHX01001556.1.p1  ORF type:complete len:533 (+),score=102.59 GAHX01001556.1:28-1599(+)
MDKIDIKRVLPSDELVDAVLHKITTSTNNTVHARFKMVKIRKFYINKVLLVRNEYSTRLKYIVKSFPQINDLSPFMKSMMSILYDFDSYKIALSHISYCTNAIEKAATNSIKLIKYADTSYNCKQLKIAAFGHMSKIVKRQKKYLLFLENVRTHLMRIPKINHRQPTLVLCGLPNTGKSSLLNWLTRANSDIESYAFSTTSIFRGFLDHEGVQKQILDTPGLLDRSFEERNSAEMQGIIAIGKLNCEIMFCVDVAADIGEQFNLLKNIKVLFYNEGEQKKLNIVLTKTDLIQDRYKQVKEEVENCIKELSTEHGLNVQHLIESDGSLTSIENIKNKLCNIDEGANTRKFQNIIAPKNKIIKINNINSLAVEHKELNNMMEEDCAVENDIREFHQLENKEWKHDLVPEIYQGENVRDYNFTNNVEKLQQLIKEEADLEEEFKTMKEQMSKQIFDKEYKDLKEKEKEEIENRIMGIVSRIVDTSKKGNRVPKAKLVAMREKRRKSKNEFSKKLSTIKKVNIKKKK